MLDTTDNAKLVEELPRCGYFVGKTTPAGCRGVIDYATRLAIVLHEKHYPEVTNWQPARGNLSTLLMQIDNMTADLVRPTALASANALNERLVAELKAATGYLLNARIDLETGATKKTAIQTIDGGLKRIRKLLSDMGKGDGG